MMKDDADNAPLANRTTHSSFLLAQTMTEPSRVQDDARGTSPEIRELLKGNTTLLVWLVFLAFGGGILALYYARIGYMPDIEWSSSLVYLAVASFIGGGVGLLYALSLLLPGLIWAEFLLYDPHLGKVFRFDRRSGELCIRTVVRYLGVPFFVVLLVSHIFLKADGLPVSAQLIVSVGLTITYLMLAVLLLVLTFFGMKMILMRLLTPVRRRLVTPPLTTSPPLSEDLDKGQSVSRYKRKRRSRDETMRRHLFKRSFMRLLTPVRRRLVTPPPTTSPPLSEDLDKGQSVSRHKRKRHSRETMRRHLFKYAIWFTLSVFLSQISMLLLYRLSGPLSWGPFGVLTAICTCGVFVSNHVVAIRYRQHPRQAVAASVVAALVLLFVADQFSSLSVGIMDHYGFGKNHKANLLLNQDGLAIIDRLGLPDKCRTPNREGLCDVEVLSKLGSELFLRIGCCKVHPGRTFTLPKSTVISFISTEENPDKDNECSQTQ